MKRCSKRFRHAESTSNLKPNSTTAAMRFAEAPPVGPGRIYPDLLPENVWGPSLRKLLSRTEWDRLRLSVGEAAGMRCTVCGQPNYDPQDGRPRLPECHQLWHFDLSGPFAVQRLAALVALCDDCHRVRHLGSATMRGELPLVIMHLRAVNCWTSAEIRLALDNANQRGQWRQRYYWDLDLSMLAGAVRVHGYPGLIIPAADRPALGDTFDGEC